jgi:hypothetical protein
MESQDSFRSFKEDAMPDKLLKSLKELLAASRRMIADSQVLRESTLRRAEELRADRERTTRNHFSLKQLGCRGWLKYLRSE